MIQGKTKIEFYKANGKKFTYTYMFVYLLWMYLGKKVLILQNKEFPFVRNIYFNFDYLGTSQSST